MNVFFPTDSGRGMHHEGWVAGWMGWSGLNKWVGACSGLG